MILIKKKVGPSQSLALSFHDNRYDIKMLNTRYINYKKRNSNRYYKLLVVIAKKNIKKISSEKMLLCNYLKHCLTKLSNIYLV